MLKGILFYLIAQNAILSQVLLILEFPVVLTADTQGENVVQFTIFSRKVGVMGREPRKRGKGGSLKMGLIVQIIRMSLADPWISRWSEEAPIGWGGGLPMSNAGAFW